MSDTGHLSGYVTTSSWVDAMNTNQRVVTLCGLGVKTGMVRVWVAGKNCVIPLLHMGHI